MAAVPVTSLLEVEDLHVSYGGALGDLKAVDGVSLTVEPGEVVAVVGESGSGKSTLAMAVLGLLPGTGRIDGGAVVLGGDVDMTALSERALRSVRGRRIGLIPQDPTVSLNPVTKVGDQVAEVLRVHGLADRRTAKIEAVALLERAGLDGAAVRAGQYPHELSGGMRQRVLIAIAIAANPSLIIVEVVEDAPLHGGVQRASSTTSTSSPAHPAPRCC